MAKNFDRNWKRSEKINVMKVLNIEIKMNFHLVWSITSFVCKKREREIEHCILISLLSKLPILPHTYCAGIIFYCKINF